MSKAQGWLELEKVIYDAALEHIGHKVVLKQFRDGHGEWVSFLCEECKMTICHADKPETVTE